MKKSGTTEFRKVAFYPSRRAVEIAATKIIGIKKKNR
jgi:hypothetical protein